MFRNDLNISRPIRVLLVEDSPLYQKILRGILSENDEFEVVAVASNGLEAIKYSNLYKPDIISMDIFMPVMDGIEATKMIMQSNPVPIVIVSNVYQTSDTDIAIKELDAGAVYILPKPVGPSDSNYSKEAVKYRNTLRIMSEIKVVKRINRSNGSSYTNTNSILINNSEGVSTLRPKINCMPPKIVKIIAIGASAGGPESIKILLSNLSEDVVTPIVVVQHIDPHFIEGFASWLNNYSNRRVKVATNDELLEEKTVYIAPGERHMRIEKRMAISFSDYKKSNGHVPSVDVLFDSINKVCAKESIAILLSGMGRDGADGLKNLSDSGSYTFAQNQESSLVYGMPKEAVKLGAACRVLSPEDIAKEINSILNKKQITI
jgi:two-component system chemotaxis response regulator CheB